MAPGALGGRSELWPSLGIVLGGAMWGLFWLPIRWLGELGLSGGWPGAVVYAAGVALLLPAVAWRWATIKRHWRALLMSGIFTGTAFACYSTSILLTEVVRTILLFYLTPVWSTILGVALLGERLTAARAMALALGLGGLLVVLGLGAQIPWPRNLGDWLALASGAAWSYGSLRLYRMGEVATLGQMLSFVLGGLVVSLLGLALGAALGSDLLGSTPAPATLVAALPLGFGVALFVVPMLFLTIWPCSLLSPGRIGILLMSDVIVGIASAAWLAGEPFGMREILGSALIIAAGAVEVFGKRGN